MVSSVTRLRSWQPTDLMVDGVWMVDDLRAYLGCVFAIDDPIQNIKKYYWLPEQAVGRN